MLRRALPAAVDALAVGGRIVVMSYHSLEDKLAKAALVAGARDDLPADLPVTADALRPELRLLTRGAEQASDGRDRGQPPRPVGPRPRRRAAAREQRRMTRTTHSTCTTAHAAPRHQQHDEGAPRT